MKQKQVSRNKVKKGPNAEGAAAAELSVMSMQDESIGLLSQFKRQLPGTRSDEFESFNNFRR